MDTYIVVGVIILLVAVGTIYTIKHFRRDGGCCGGGGSFKLKKKNLPRVVYKKVFIIDGMHCDHCKNRVEEIVGDIKNVAGKVNLNKGELVVSYAEEVDDEIIKSRIERVGYTVLAIKNVD